MSLSIGNTTSIVFKTLPYIFLRLIVYMLFGLLFLLYLGLVGVLANALKGLHENAQALTWIFGVITSFPLYRLAREYLLYLVKAGHVAVIAQLATKGGLPEGVSQIQWGREQVQSRFKQASVLFLVDQLVNSVIRSVNSMMARIGNLFSALPGTQGLIKVVNTILFFSLTYIDEAILARNFVRKNEGVWQSAKTGVVLYAQSWRQILTTAIVAGLGAMVFIPVVFLLLLMPALGVGQMWPELKIPAIAAALVFSFLLKSVFLDPWTLTAMILTYLKTTENMAVNAEWEQKIEAVSGKFKKLKEKAIQAEPAVA